jgi:peptide/nickel transport system permease protein
MMLAVLGQGVDKVILALVLVQWAYFARAVRATALVERTKEYVEAAVGLGFSPMRVLIGHILPNCMPPVIVIGTLQVANAISAEATLSFLGIGLPITQPSLGLLIANGYQVLLSGEYWVSVYPGLLLLALVFSINIVGDRLREVLNPRLAE